MRRNTEIISKQQINFRDAFPSPLDHLPEDDHIDIEMEVFRHSFFFGNGLSCLFLQCSVCFYHLCQKYGAQNMIFIMMELNRYHVLFSKYNFHFLKSIICI